MAFFAIHNTRVICNNCKNDITQITGYCPHCGYRLAPVNTPQPTPCPPTQNTQASLANYVAGLKLLGNQLTIPSTTQLLPGFSANIPRIPTISNPLLVNPNSYYVPPFPVTTFLSLLSPVTTFLSPPFPGDYR